MLSICARFQLDGTPLSCERYGNGHINETYLVKTEKDSWYILQKINDRIFRHVDRLMSNIARVTGFLASGQNDPRLVLTLVKTLEGADYLSCEEGFFRTYVFVRDSVCLDRAESPNDFYQSAVAFGRFQNDLAAFPAHTLFETIPHFHDTPARYKALHEAIQNDLKGRASKAQEEIRFALAREPEADTMTGMLRRGDLPLRVTHNDTKLNNVMLDAKTRTPLCVIDLDTVMPGLAGNDFGDSIRFGASTAAEDETDLSLVQMSLELFAAYARGFLEECGKNLSPNEISTLPWGAKLMTLECGVRFLTDYLNGDSYFHIKRPDHNLDRCRTQFKLVADMESKWQEMNDIIKEEASK